jgi:toxin ParE1/3/4
VKDIRLSIRAEENLGEIHSSYSRDGAYVLLTSLRQRAEEIAEHPEYGENRSEIEAGLRSASAEHYVIYYHEVPNGIKIDALAHAGKDPRTIFAKDPELEQELEQLPTRMGEDRTAAEQSILKEEGIVKEPIESTIEEPQQGEDSITYKFWGDTYEYSADAGRDFHHWMVHAMKRGNLEIADEDRATAQRWYDESPKDPPQSAERQKYLILREEEDTPNHIAFGMRYDFHKDKVSLIQLKHLEQSGDYLEEQDAEKLPQWIAEKENNIILLESIMRNVTADEFEQFKQEANAEQEYKELTPATANFGELREFWRDVYFDKVQITGEDFNKAKYWVDERDLSHKDFLTATGQPIPDNPPPINADEPIYLVSGWRETDVKTEDARVYGWTGLREFNNNSSAIELKELKVLHEQGSISLSDRSQNLLEQLLNEKIELDRQEDLSAPKSDFQRLMDIQARFDRIEEVLVAGGSVFDPDPDVKESLRQDLIYIGNEAGKISPEFQEQHSELNFQALVSMGKEAAIEGSDIVFIIADIPTFNEKATNILEYEVQKSERQEDLLAPKSDLQRLVDLDERCDRYGENKETLAADGKYIVEESGKFSAEFHDLHPEFQLSELMGLDISAFREVISDVMKQEVDRHQDIDLGHDEPGISL